MANAVRRFSTSLARAAKVEGPSAVAGEHSGKF